MVFLSKLHSTLLLLAVLLFTGCKDTLVGENPSNTFENNFNILWNTFDKNYSYFEHKSINWDSLYTVYYTNLDTITSDIGFFDHTSKLLEELKDGHANLTAPFAVYSYTDWRKTIYNEVFIDFRYLETSSKPSPDSPFIEGEIANNIGYLHIGSFDGAEHLFKEIDSILKRAALKKGLIIDVRTNGGGKDVNSRMVLSRFADQKRLIRKIRYRNGPNHSDFTPFIYNEIEPNGFYFDKPLVLITDQSTFSAAEDFVLGMRQFPTVTILGEFTGGGSGNPATFDLPNGWLFTVSRWQIFQPENNELYEGFGLEPDSVVLQNNNDSIFGIDTKMSTAISLINKAE